MYEDEVAPDMLSEPFFHRYERTVPVSLSEPITTVKVTGVPTLLVVLEGCVEIVGTSGVTVKLVLEVAVPPAVVTEIA